MHWSYVNSTAIRAIGYDGSTLAVIFRSGRRYDLPGVPSSVYHEFVAAGSHGIYFNRYLKGRYK
jgi:hypothetical protein